MHVVLPPISTGGASSRSGFPRRQHPISTNSSGRVLRPVPRAEVDALVARRANLLITGAGGSGKTTLLGRCSDPRRRTSGSS